MMGEGGFRPESAKQFESSDAEVEKKPESTPELIVNITEKELNESQSIFARSHGAESWEKLNPLDRAESWAIEGNYEGNHLEAEKAAKGAGLDRQKQLEFMKRALKSRMNALSYSSDKKHIHEFHSLDAISMSLNQELEDLKKLPK